MLSKLRRLFTRLKRDRHDCVKYSPCDTLLPTLHCKASDYHEFTKEQLLNSINSRSSHLLSRWGKNDRDRLNSLTKVPTFDDATRVILNDFRNEIEARIKSKSISGLGDLSHHALTVILVGLWYQGEDHIRPYGYLVADLFKW